MNLQELAILTLFALVAMLIWHHHNVSRLAYQATFKHTHLNGVVLLDQTIVLNKIRLKRSHRTLFAVERQYKFEFSSIGDTRYPGMVTFSGSRFTHIELSPFKTPSQDEPLN